jgi:tellurite methyltransferase
MDKSYWDKFYSKNPDLHQPSNFAKYILNFMEQNNLKVNLFDLGCGNARDTVYFALNNVSAHGIDQSHEAIEIDKNKYKVNQNLSFSSDDFTRFEFDDFNFKNNNLKYSLYSRFTLHAINYSEEEVLLKNISTLKNLEWLFFEARTIRDKIYGQGEQVGEHEFVTSHYRRFIDPEAFIDKVENLGFKVVDFSESEGYSKLNENDPNLMRLIINKKN